MVDKPHALGSLLEALTQGDPAEAAAILEGMAANIQRGGSWALTMVDRRATEALIRQAGAWLGRLGSAQRAPRPNAAVARWGSAQQIAAALRQMAAELRRLSPSG
jgi:hypothetical protein